MNSLFVSIGHNLRRLFDFSGRETRLQFWPYVVMLFIVSMIVDLVLIMLQLFDMIVRIQLYLTEHPEGWPQPDDGISGQQLPPELMPDFAAMMVPMALVSLVFMLLIAAAVVRRLHDRDMTGLWGLLPLPFMAAGYAMAPRAFAGMRGGAFPDPAIFALIGLNNLLTWAALIVLILFLVLEGTKGPNRYGPEPPQHP